VSPATAGVYVSAGNDLHRLPDGLVLGVPTDAAALEGSPLVAGDAAERVRREPALPGAPLAPGDDPSVGELIRRRLGDDILEHLVDPLVGGINAGDSDRLSVRAAAPQLAAAAERSASLVEGLRAAPATFPAGTPVFWALPGGMAVLVDTLVAALAGAGVCFEPVAVDDLLALGRAGRSGVVVATPAKATAALLGRAGAEEASAILGGIVHSSPVMVTFAYPADAAGRALDASGVLVPRSEGRFVTAVSFATSKWAHLGAADPSTVLLRASAGRMGDDRAIDLADGDLLDRMQVDLEELLGLDGDPVAIRIARWRDGFPQYEPGHLDRVAAAEADVAARLPRVALAGAAHRGIGIPACIRQGRAAARHLAP
jgi:oxygen-dependent protoporphyrinogen oxidase